jgi:hypothetical protein
MGVMDAFAMPKFGSGIGTGIRSAIRSGIVLFFYKFSPFELSATV